jgi:tripartite-type tricarboxylate transporter receptor subunit TctC
MDCRSNWQVIRSATRATSLAASLVGAMLGLYIASAVALAQGSETDAAAFYRDRTMTMLSGSAVGGGYDAYARLVARHLPAQLPGKATFIVQNMPGGGGIHAANTLYNISARDGSVIALLQRGVLTAPLLDPKQANFKFDPRHFNWLQSLNSEAGLIIVWNTAPHKSLDDLMKDELTIGSSGPATEIFPRLLRNLFGMKLRIISGYKGSADAYLAMERGEVQGRISTGYDKAILTPWLEQGKVRLLLSISLNKHPYFPDLPLVSSLSRNESDQAIIELFLAEQLAGRPILTSPGVPTERVAFMRTALNQMAQDKSFLEEARKLNLDIDIVMGAEIANMINRVYAISPEIVDRARKIISAQ